MPRLRTYLVEYFDRKKVLRASFMLSAPTKAIAKKMASAQKKVFFEENHEKFKTMMTIVGKS